MKSLYILILFHIVSGYCIGQVKTVYPTTQTDNVLNSGDFADDAVIWIHPTIEDSSFLIGVDKSPNGRLEYYNSDGTRYNATNDLTKSFNNLSLTYGYKINGQEQDIVAASNRTDDKIQFFKVDSNSRTLIDISGNCLLGFEPYGIALYQDKIKDSLFCFVSRRTAPFNVLQYAVTDSSELLNIILVRTLSVSALTEGLIVDEKLGHLYVSVEDEALYKYDAHSNGGQSKSLIDSIGSSTIGGSDIEGVALYHLTDTTGYIIVSVQFDNTFNIYHREGSNSYIGTFEIGGNGTIDETEITDGIFVSSTAFTSTFPNGVFVAHDATSASGYTNYKLVPWEAIADSFNLQINPNYDPRCLPTTASNTDIYTSLDERFIVYPNPSSERISIKLPQSLDAGTIRLMNSSSQLISEKTISPYHQEITMDMTGYSNGLYFIHISTMEKNYTLKIIKQ